MKDSTINMYIYEYTYMYTQSYISLLMLLYIGVYYNICVSTMYVYYVYYNVCRYNDPPYVKMKKVELLTELCNVENAESVVNELG